MNLTELTKEFRKQKIAEALEKTGNNRSKAAELLGLTRVSFHAQLKRYGFESVQHRGNWGD